jgi:hypothetical protein
MTSEMTKPTNKDELTKALKQKSWTFLESFEVVNRDDLRDLHSRTSSLVTKGKKLCVAIIERE